MPAKTRPKVSAAAAARARAWLEKLLRHGDRAQGPAGKRAAPRGGSRRAAAEEGVVLPSD
jgi:hypothetical protein